MWSKEQWALIPLKSFTIVEVLSKAGLPPVEIFNRCPVYDKEVDWVAVEQIIANYIQGGASPEGAKSYTVAPIGESAPIPAPPAPMKKGKRGRPKK